MVSFRLHQKQIQKQLSKQKHINSYTLMAKIQEPAYCIFKPFNHHHFGERSRAQSMCYTRRTLLQVLLNRSAEPEYSCTIDRFRSFFSRTAVKLVSSICPQNFVDFQIFKRQMNSFLTQKSSLDLQFFFGICDCGITCRLI